jgi:hypothetical protein
MTWRRGSPTSLRFISFTPEERRILQHMLPSFLQHWPGSSGL